MNIEGYFSLLLALTKSALIGEVNTSNIICIVLFFFATWVHQKNTKFDTSTSYYIHSAVLTVESN